ncbi:MAG: TIGR02281 family clan AA aspartic protease [Pseudomonadales bacterium]|nr:TIGR02281 family clan AA aspartic protease [Pseudomonadales bacterium]
MSEVARWGMLVAAMFVSLCATAVAQDLYVTANALFEGRAMLSIDGTPRMLQVGETSPEGVRLVAASATLAVIDVGGRRQTLAPGRDAGANFSQPARREVPVSRNAHNQYLVIGTINSRQLNLLVDTGASVIAMNSADARRLGIDYRLHGEPGRVQTASGEVDAWTLMLDRVELSGIVVRNVRASVLEGAYPMRALLGMSWLGRVSMREENGVLYLREK